MLAAMIRLWLRHGRLPHPTSMPIRTDMCRRIRPNATPRCWFSSGGAAGDDGSGRMGDTHGTTENKEPLIQPPLGEEQPLTGLNNKIINNKEETAETALIASSELVSSSSETTATTTDTTSTTTKKKTVKVLFCYSKYEVMPGVTFDNDVGQEDIELSVPEIRKQAVEFLSAVEGDPIEYYNGEEWIVLNDSDTHVLESYAESGQMLPIRIDYLFDTSDHPDMVDKDDAHNNDRPLFRSDNDTDGNNKNKQKLNLMDSLKNNDVQDAVYKKLSDAVAALVQTMREQGYSTTPPSCVTAATPSTAGSSALTVGQQSSVTSAEPLLLWQAPKLPSSSEKATTDNDSAAASSSSPVSIPTLDWVLEQVRRTKAQGDFKLANTMVMHVGALHHICQCLHSYSYLGDIGSGGNVFQEHGHDHHHNHNHDAHGRCIEN